MAHENEFTALGPSDTHSGFPRAGFSTSASDMVYGANVVGDRCGVYGQSGSLPDSNRESQVPGVGVHGRGENFGVVGDGQGIAAVYGHANRSKVGVLGGAMRKGIGVVGASMQSLNPSEFARIPDPGNGPGTGVFGTSGTGTGVHGSSAQGVGVRGHGSVGVGVLGESQEESGVQGVSRNGVGARGDSENNVGILGRSGISVGVWGNGGVGRGVLGDSQDEAGVHGVSINSHGVRGEGTTGVFGFSTTIGSAGVLGRNNGGHGVRGVGETGVQGEGGSGVVGICSAPEGSGGAGSSSSIPFGGVVGFSSSSGFPAVVGNHTGEGDGYGVAGVGKGPGHAGVLGRNSSGPGIHGQGNYGGQFEGGSAQLRLVPGNTAGRPTAGDHSMGEIYMDSAATLWVCVANGNPGTWVRVLTAE
jgi:hypothetical protein